MKQNYTLLQGFEWYLPEDRNHWKLLTQRAKELAEAGITHIWLPPAFKGAAGVSDVGYGVYDTYDLGEFDQKGSIATKYGTKEEYLTAIRTLQKNGIKVLSDIVLNHRMGADEKEKVLAAVVNGQNRMAECEKEHEVEVWSKFTFPGRGGTYSDFQWNWTHFDGADWDEERRQKAILRFHGKDWESDVDGENVNYDYLMGADLDMSNEEVLAELNRWAKWYLETTGVDGFRLDALKHIRFTFYKEWLEKLRSETKRELPSVGEYWSPDVNQLCRYLESSGRCCRLFDVPLHFQLFRASTGGGNFDMTTLMNNTLSAADGSMAVTFVDNHDTQPGQALQSWVDGWFRPLAYALILLQKDGVPCVFWGDLYGIPHNGIAPLPELPKLIKLRQSNAWGEQRNYFDHFNVVGFTRAGDEKHPGLALLISDGPGGMKNMYVGQEYKGCRFYDALGKCPETVTVGDNGCADFRVEGGSVSVWIPADDWRAV